MLKIANVEYLGQFKVNSGLLRVSDPCYDKSIWCTGTIADVKNGTWEAYMKLDPSGNRVSELLTFHKDTTAKLIRNDRWDEQNIDIGVESGQCGIFDNSSYPDGDVGVADESDSFYGKCRQATESDFGGVIDFGTISNSGYGNGSYLCYTMEDRDGITAVKIVFIEKEDEDDDEVEELNYDFDDDNKDYYNYDDDY
jgi:hypothetical protein